MNLWEYRLQTDSPFITPWQGDTLFGHLAWAYKDLFGEEALEKWLVEFGEQPPFIVSDGFLSGTLPRPLLPAKRRNHESKSDILTGIAEAKKMKSLRYISQDDLRAMLNGEKMTPSADEASIRTKNFIQTHNTINRDTGSSLEKDGLYEVEGTVIDAHISIFVRVRNEESLQLFEKLLKLVSLEGYGNKKTAGFGQFTVVERLRRDDLDAEASGNAVLWLSHGIPDKGDPISGWYKLETKYGKLSERLAAEGRVFKKPLTRIMPGAVFKTDEPKPYYGKMIRNIVNHNDKVVQYGFALAIPLRLPAHLE